MSKYLDNDGLLYLWNSKIKPLVAKYLPLTGGTLTGKLTLGAAPNADMDAATKKYVDDSVASAGGGDMLKSVYDKDGNGVVDDAQKVNGHTVEKDVPADAVFTDTKYEAATASSPGLDRCGLQQARSLQRGKRLCQKDGYHRPLQVQGQQGDIFCPSHERE